MDPCECVSVLYSLVFSVLRNDMYQYRIPRIVDDTDIAITIAIAIAEPQYNLSKGKKNAPKQMPLDGAWITETE